MSFEVSETLRKAFGSTDYPNNYPPLVGALYAIAKAIDNLADAQRERTAFETGNMNALLGSELDEGQQVGEKTSR